MSRGLKAGDVYQDQEEQAKRAAIIVSVTPDGTQAYLEYLDGGGDFPATQDQLVSRTIIGSLAYKGDPSPYRIEKTGRNGASRWITYAANLNTARIMLEQASKDGSAVTRIVQS